MNRIDGFTNSLQMLMPEISEGDLLRASIAAVLCSPGVCNATFDGPILSHSTARAGRVRQRLSLGLTCKA